jgi:murein DD-endopeptidase MepM/ murein hydrolase activator NlpD
MPPTPTPVLINKICSPLANETLESITEILTQAYKQPRSGNDDGHQGLDFAFYRRLDRIGIEGLPVLASLPGKVVAVINDRWPYGNAIIIETPMDLLAPDLVTSINVPLLQPTVMPDPRVNCPPGELPFTIKESSRSLYLLYGHLIDNPTLLPGEEVLCGQQLGEVGNSGYSSNPHLHFETRIGPSGAHFDSMAYYIAGSYEAERYNYCVWRVSNLFQLFDPMQLLSAQKE